VTRFYSEALGKHDRSAFSSGNERIDAYFRTTVSQDVKRHYAQCYVLIERETSRLAGFYSLSATNIPLTEIAADVARKLPRYPSVPAALIGWLGRDLGFRGQEIGAMLLRDAVVRVAASNIGVYALCADAIDDAAVEFYRRFLFTVFESRPRSLFLPIATAIQAFEKVKK
jgi:ribosomal protein S18 acetylase RimI-like enzyme